MRSCPLSTPAASAPRRQDLTRRIHIGDEGETSWQTWLVSDQRDPASRTDVLSFSTPVLKEFVKISGQPIANLVASTSGTDGDFVVKLIDVYPDEMGREPKMGGYELQESDHQDIRWRIEREFRRFAGGAIRAVRTARAVSIAD